MYVVSIVAIYFILWWVVLFAMLPVGFRTQEEEGDFLLGTVASAPGRPHMLRVVIRTTLLSALIFAIFYGVVLYFGLSFDDVPRIGPSLR